MFLFLIITLLSLPFLQCIQFNGQTSHQIEELYKNAVAGWTRSSRHVQKVYLHVGPEKTGSTTMQTFVDKPKVWTYLLRNGVYSVPHGYIMAESFMLNNDEEYKSSALDLVRNRVHDTHDWFSLLVRILKEEILDVLWSAENLCRFNLNMLGKLRNFLGDNVNVLASKNMFIS